MILILGSMVAGSAYPLLLIYLVVSQYILVGLHEFGHVVAAWSVGLSPVAVKIGTGREIFDFRCGSIRVSIGLGFFCGRVEVNAGEGQWTRKKNLVLCLGGPLASLVTLAGGLCFLLALDSENPLFHIFPQPLFAAMFVAQHLFIFSGPLGSEVVVDGKRMRSDLTAILVDISISDDRWELLQKRREHEVADQLSEGEWWYTWENAESHLQALPQYAGLLAHFTISAGKEAAPKLEALANETLSGSCPNKEEFGLLLFVRAGCLAYRGDTAAARACLDEAMETAETGELKVALCELAANLVIISRLMELLPDVDRYSQLALQLQPEEITLKGTRGSILVESGLILAGTKMLLEVFEQSDSENDKTISAFYLALACRKAGDDPSVQSWRDKMMQNDPPAWLMARAEELGGEPNRTGAETVRDAEREAP